MTTHNLPVVEIRIPHVVVESFILNHQGVYEPWQRSTYGTLGPARNKLSQMARYCTERKINPSYWDTWTYGKNKTQCDDFKMETEMLRRGTAFIMRVSQYDNTTSQYVTVDQFEFGP